MQNVRCIFRALSAKLKALFGKEDDPCDHDMMSEVGTTVVCPHCHKVVGQHRNPTVETAHERW